MKKTFIIHSKNAEDACDALEMQLNFPEVFYNKNVRSGDDIQARKETLLRESEVYLLLINSHFFDDEEDCLQLLQIAKAECEANPSKVILPVLFNFFDWESMPELMEYHHNVVPCSKKYINQTSSWSNIEEAYFTVAKDIKNRLGLESKTRKPLGKFSYLTCNRADQMAVFSSNFRTKKNEKNTQQYLIKAEAQDSPEVLAERFNETIKKELTTDVCYKRVLLEIDGNLSHFQSSFRNQMYNDFNPYTGALDTLSSSDIIQDIQRKKLKAIVVKHQIAIKKWNLQSQAAIEWMFNDFWREQPCGEKSPHLILFFNFNFSEIKLSGFLSFLNKNGKIEKIKNDVYVLLEKKSNFKSLPPLSLIKQNDVTKWAESNKIQHNISILKTCLPNVFKSENKDGVPMQEVIDGLQKVISHYNQNQ